MRFLTLKPLRSAKQNIEKIQGELKGFFFFLFIVYGKKKIVSFSVSFEKSKNKLVKFFLMKRGRYNRPFLHLTTMAVLGIGVLVAPFLADTYPIFSSNAQSLKDLQQEVEPQSISVSDDVFQTKESVKPRNKIVTYTVQKGDTITTIAKKYSISVETIKWSNDLTSDTLAIGDEIKILPVTGMSHKVSKGDTVYSIAKKYDTEAQKIVDFPFNDFANPETFALVEGQIVIVPDGIKPSERPTIRRQVYIASGPSTISGSGFTWPVQGPVSQFAAWYHMALDITSPLGTPILAAQSGKVSIVSAGGWDGGYGTNLYVDGPDGRTHYAHMSGVNVSMGDNVIAGRTVVGWVGMTGRTTGPHVHFEIMKNGQLVNPISYLP